MDLIHGWLWKNQHLLHLQSAANNKNSYCFPLLEGTCTSIWEQTPELLCREWEVPLGSLTLCQAAPASSHTKHDQNCCKRDWNLWTLGGGEQGGISVTGENCTWLWLENASSSSKLPEDKLPEVPPGLNYSMTLWYAFPYLPSDEPTINLFVKHVVSSWFKASWHYL